MHSQFFLAPPIVSDRCQLPAAINRTNYRLTPENVAKIDIAIEKTASGAGKLQQFLALWKSLSTECATLLIQS